MGQYMSGLIFSDPIENNNNNNDNMNGSDSNNSSSLHTSPKQDGPYKGSQRRNLRGHKKIPRERKLTDNELQQITFDVLDLIYDWFPELDRRTYFLPPVHMNKVQYETVPSPGAPVLKIQTTPESDWRDDEAMQRVLHCLRALTDNRKEAMVVLLQMQHDNYMHKPCYAAAAAMFPRPCDLPTNLKRGDFDVLFLHRQHGLIVAEIKSVGWRPGGQQDDSTVKKKVTQAVDQIVKARKVLDHLVSDLQPLPKISATLILPNVSSQRLLKLLEQEPQLAEEFCRCLGTSDVVSAVSVCLCSQQMTSVEKPADVTETILENLDLWWRHLVANAGYNVHGCAEDVYDLLVARFCGPASTVQVHCVRPPRLEFRTLGHAVQEVGERMVQFVLFPEQLALLEEEEPCIFLTGPPGTGKTLLLMLVALKWSKGGQEVHVLSTESFSEAAAQLLYYQVTQTLAATDPEAAQRIKLHSNGNSTRHTQAIFEELCAASGALMSSPLPGVSQGAHQGGQLFIVADEVQEQFRDLFALLRNNVADLHVWAASYSPKQRPDNMEERQLSTCLRSTPIIQRRMETAVSFEQGAVYRFEDRRGDYLAPSEGPAELYLSHEHHLSLSAMECVECGQDIADCLLNKLGVGQTRPAVKTAVKTPPPLRYSDVIIIPDWYQNTQNISDGDDVDLQTGEARKASGIIQGLRSRGVPVYAVRSHDIDKIRDLAQSSRDAVAVVEWGVSNGLERKVVVSVGMGRQMSNGVSGVLHGSSRCVSQLINVRCPEE